MIETTVQLFCDSCESAYPADPRITGDATTIRVAAAQDGWAGSGRGRSRRDTCPPCQQAAVDTGSSPSGSASDD